MRTTHLRGRARRVTAAAIVAATLVAGAGVAAANTAFTSTRIAGDDRYATAAKIAVDSFDKSTGAIVATGEAFPDALAASFIAGYVNAPILLVERDRIPAATASTLTQLGVKEVVILGGSAAVSDNVQEQLDVDYEVVRLSGQDRFATAANIALAVNSGDIGELGGKRTAFLTYGYNYADALAVGPLAFAGRFPILLNGSAGLGTPTKVVLDRLDIAHVVVVGGVISKQAVDELTALGISSERLQGPDRYATAAAVADFALARLGFVPDHVNLVRGVDPADPQRGFADALAGSVHAGREQSVLLLTHPTTLSAATAAWLEDHASALVDGDILGGPGGVSPTVEEAAVTAARRVPGTVTAVDAAGGTYTFRGDDATVETTVTFGRDDTFLVDGSTVDLDAFIAAISVGDGIRFTTARGARHELTNTASS